MRTLPIVAWIVAAQLAVGAALVVTIAACFERTDRVSRRRRVRWSRAARLLAVLLPPALALVAAGTLPPLHLRPTLPLVALALLGAPAAAGSALLIAAARVERAGRTRRARLLARTGGELAAAGIAVSLAWVAIGPGRTLGGAPMLGAAGIWLVAAPTALLSGWSGKPRPTGPFAVVCYLAGLALFFAA